MRKATILRNKGESVTTYIYARVSTGGQSPEAQALKLQELFPGALVVPEIASGVKERPILAALIEALQPGDTLAITAIDRLGRSMDEVIRTVRNLHDRGVNIYSEREKIDFGSPAGKMLVGVMATLAEMERDINSERTKQGLERVRKAGVHLGRPFKFDDTERAEMLRRYESGMWTIARLAREYKVHKDTIRRAIRDEVRKRNAEEIAIGEFLETKEDTSA